jgi:predicted DNA-binding transcriptional regulator YafY
MKNLIQAAIQSRTLLTFRHDGTLRVVEPYNLGFQGDQLCLHGWQTNSKRPGWKVFRLVDVQHLTTLESHYDRARSGHSNVPSDWKQVCSVTSGVHHSACG